MGNNGIRAKLFISCGQRPEGGEVGIAHEISQELQRLGFEPYVAVYEQSLRSLRENIYAHLEISEYFLFVDFKRDKLEDKDTYRGSLFCHQELAIASYLGLPIIAFHEEGVEQRNGVIGILQVNSIPFSDRNSLPGRVVAAVGARHWDPNSKNKLTIDSGKVEKHQAVVPSGRSGIWYGIPVKNQHSRRAAVDCFAYLARLYDVSRNEEISLRTTELVWSGYTQPNAMIAPKQSRLFDAFVVWADRQNECVVQGHTGCSLNIPKIRGPGDYKLRYEIRAKNFPIAAADFELHVGQTVGEIRLVPSQSSGEAKGARSSSES